MSHSEQCSLNVSCNTQLFMLVQFSIFCTKSDLRLLALGTHDVLIHVSAKPRQRYSNKPTVYSLPDCYLCKVSFAEDTDKNTLTNLCLQTNGQIFSVKYLNFKTTQHSFSKILQWSGLLDIKMRLMLAGQAYLQHLQL